MEGIRYVSTKQVAEITSLSPRSISRKVAAGQFPKPVRLGEGARQAFVEGEVFAWNADQLARARGHSPPVTQEPDSSTGQLRTGRRSSKRNVASAGR
jgi:predicted DNA-binding transcriptional regulator AlpA